MARSSRICPWSPTHYNSMSRLQYGNKIIKRFGNEWRGISNEKLRKTDLVKKYPKFIEQRYVGFPVPGNIDIMKDKVLITVWKDRVIGILIHSKETADSFRQYFDSVWEQAKI